MQVIGFNLTKISAERELELERTSPPITDIKFTNIEKKGNKLLKDADVLAIFFEFTLTYENSKKKKEGKVAFEGAILLSTNKEQTKQFIKSWKKKEIPKEYVMSLYNFILRRCTVRAVELEDNVGLPIHVPIPQFRPKKSN